MRAVRERGIEVHTFSVRPPGAHATLSREHEEAAGETVCILGRPWELLRDCAAGRASRIPWWSIR